MKFPLKFLRHCGLAVCLLATAAPAVQVTFQVNMGVQRDMGLFDPVNDFVFVAGDFNSWSETASMLTQSPTNADLWIGTFDAGSAGTWPNFKFLKNRLGIGNQWEVNGVGDGGAQNRWFQVPASEAALPVVYFNNITNVSLNYAPVTFQVNMSVQIKQGSFDPSSGTLTVAGDALNNWDNNNFPLALAQSPGDTNIWTVTLSVTNPIGTQVSYKFIMNGTWESVANRTFVMTNIAQTIPAVYFNDVTNTATSIPLTFRVNMGVQIARGNFNPETDVVEARGSFLLGAGSTWLGGFTLTNSDPANPLIYSGTIVDTNDASGSTVNYKFVLNNGATWETIADRSVVLTSTNATTVPAAFFNDVSNLGSLTMGPVSSGQTMFTWTAGPYIRLQGSTNLSSWHDIDGTQGQGTVNVNVGSGAQFFRLVGP